MCTAAHHTRKNKHNAIKYTEASGANAQTKKKHACQCCFNDIFSFAQNFWIISFKEKRPFGSHTTMVLKIYIVTHSSQCRCT